MLLELATMASMPMMVIHRFHGTRPLAAEYQAASITMMCEIGLNPRGCQNVALPGQAVPQCGVDSLRMLPQARTPAKMAYCTVFKVLHSKILQSCCGNYLNGRPLYGSGEGHIYSMMQVNSYNICMSDGRFCKA